MSDFLGLVSLVAFVAAIVLLVRLLRATTPSTRRTKRWLAAMATTWIAAYALSLVAWQPRPALAQDSPTGDGQPLMSVGDYEQTWSKGYAVTTCEEFSDEMSEPQRFAAASDMLTIVWMKIETSQAAPSDVLIGEFEDEMASSCQYPEQKISEVAWAVWIHDPRFSPA